MRKSFKYLALIFFSSMLFGCFEATTNSSPRLSEDFRKVNDQIRIMSNSESISLEDFRTQRGDKIIRRELRIDLTKPNPFPDNKKIRDIILKAKSTLIDADQFDMFTVTEVPRQEGNEIVVPAETILRSVTILSKDL